MVGETSRHAAENGGEGSVVAWGNGGAGGRGGGGEGEGEGVNMARAAFNRTARLQRRPDYMDDEAKRRWREEMQTFTHPPLLRAKQRPWTANEQDRLERELTKVCDMPRHRMVAGLAGRMYERTEEECARRVKEMEGWTSWKPRLVVMQRCNNAVGAVPDITDSYPYPTGPPPQRREPVHDNDAGSELNGDVFFEDDGFDAASSSGRTSRPASVMDGRDVEALEGGTRPQSSRPSSRPSSGPRDTLIRSRPASAISDFPSRPASAISGFPSRPVSAVPIPNRPASAITGIPRRPASAVSFGLTSESSFRPASEASSRFGSTSVTPLRPDSGSSLRIRPASAATSRPASANSSSAASSMSGGQVPGSRVTLSRASTGMTGFSRGTVPVTRAVQITFHMDPACPWCYTMAGRLARAVAAAETAGVRVQCDIKASLSFPLSPEGGMHVSDYCTQRWGGVSRGTRAVEEGRRDGLQMAAWERWPNSVHAARALEMARRAGGGEKQWKVANAMFCAVFEEGLDLSTPSAVAEVSSKAGLSGMLDYLQTDSDRMAVLEPPSQAASKFTPPSIAITRAGFREALPAMTGLVTEARLMRVIMSAGPRTQEEEAA